MYIRNQRLAMGDSAADIAALPKKTCKDGSVVLATYPCPGDKPNNPAFALSGTVLLMIGGVAAMVLWSEKGR